MITSRKVLGGVALASLVLTAGCGSRADEEAAAPPAETAAAPTEEAAAPAEEAAATVDYASLTGDAAAGQKVFALCSTCHAVEEGVNKVGPSLAGIIGRQAGTIEGYSYSEANKTSGKTWTEEEMFAYLEDPAAAIPGTKMVFPGLPEAQDRADVIAYLKAQ